MFVLVASTQVKPNAGSEFARVFQEQLLPSLRAQHGFRDELLFIAPGGPEIVAVMFWESRDDADVFERAAWPGFVEALTGIVDRPAIRSFQLAHSTLHGEGVAAFPGFSVITTEPTGVGA